MDGARRRFLLFGCAALAAWPVAAFVAHREPATRRVVFPLAEQGERYAARQGVYLRVTGDQVTALDARCAHLGCPVTLDAGRGLFRCPCHQSLYDLDGRRLSGPAARDLVRLVSTRLESGDIVVDLPL